VSALAVHDLPLLNITTDVVHLTLTESGFPRTLRGLRVHPRLPDTVARQRNDSRVVHPAIAVFRSAALFGVTAGVAAADAALYSGQVTKDDLEIAQWVARLGPDRGDAHIAVKLGVPGAAHHRRV
jgi:hypothetical protein